MATIVYQGSNRQLHLARKNIKEQVYATILRQRGKVRTIDLDRIFGNKKQVRSAITRLTIDGKIRRIKGFGKSSKIEYFYIDTRD